MVQVYHTYRSKLDIPFSLVNRNQNTYTIYIYTILFYGRNHLPLMDGLSIKCVITKTFFSISNSMKLGEVLVHINNYNFTNFHLIQMKNKKVYS